jgi:exodeoxyribonuclease VII large subunit
MAGFPSASRPAPRAIPVREFVARLQVSLQEAFPARLWLSGELSNFKVGRNGHAFFCLKDGEAQVEVVMWAISLAALRFTPSDGMQVQALVRKVDFYAPQGRLRLHLESIEPMGIGALYRALEERKAKLQAEGLFASERKRPLPFLPRAVGIATAETGAVIHDMLRVLGQRFAERRVLVRPCKVQGEGAAADLEAALDDLNRDASVDVIVIGRGGGSIEDLWAFNDERVVRAIARSRIPVVSAVGHEVDWTLADLVADLRAATPTAAAQHVMPERAALEAELEGFGRRLHEGLLRRLELGRGRLATCRAALGDPRGLVVERQRRLERLGSRARAALLARAPSLAMHLARLSERLGAGAPRTAAGRAALERARLRLGAAVEARLGEKRHALAERAARVEALSPLAVLSRGFALARKDDGSVVRDAAALEAGDELELSFARGGARTRVLHTSLDPAASAAETPRAGRQRGPA